MTQKVTFQEACTYLRKNNDEIQLELNLLKNNCLNNSDSNLSKIYLIKHRVKEPESVYLKTKRKDKSLDQIYDYGGLRLLCLFEEDIFAVHMDFMNMLKNKDYQLKCCSAYNWNDSSMESLKTEIDKYFDGCKFEKIRRSSGYKSVHYVIKRNSSASVRIEVQLRTLVQDVWGELEHSISYKKGGVHPHIKKSFYLLSQDLSNIENLLSYLKEVNQKEHAGEDYSNKLVVPKYFLKYENKILPEFKSINIKLYNCYAEYWAIIESIDNQLISVDWVKLARAKLDDFNNHLSVSQLKENKELSYWIGMENAFLLFCEAKHEEALDAYKILLIHYSDKYCVHFRIGELYYLLGHIEQSLYSFDEAERLLVLEEIDHVNYYRIKSKLAYYYWSLGDEYIDISVAEISEAEKIYSQHKKYFDKSQYEQLVNNICWYKLEQYIVTLKKLEAEGVDSEGNDELLNKLNVTYSELKTAYAVIDSLIRENNYESSNLLDTAAWYCYWEYKKNNDTAYLAKAKEYALSINRKKALTSYPYKSFKTHMNHIQTIMSAK